MPSLPQRERVERAGVPGALAFASTSWCAGVRVGILVRRRPRRHPALRLLLAALFLLATVSAAPAAASDSPVADAARDGDLMRVRALIAQRANVNAPQGDGMTALHWAAFNDDHAIADLLLAIGANMTVRTRVGAITPLWLAANNGSAAMIRRLITVDTDINVPTATGGTPLMAASMSGRVDAIDLLVRRGAWVNGARDREWTDRADVRRLGRPPRCHPSAGAPRRAHRPDVVRRLDDRRETGRIRQPDLRPPTPHPGWDSIMGGLTPLLIAARDGHVEAVRALVESGADIDRVSGGDGSSPMVIAIANGHYDVAQYLLDQGADVTG